MSEPADPLEQVDAFLELVTGNKHVLYIGIDPGATGGIAFLHSRYHLEIDIPTINIEVKRTKRTTEDEYVETGHLSKTVAGTTTHFNYGAICAIFRKVVRFCKDSIDIAVALEEAPASIGPGRHHADVMINRAYAMWPLFLHSKGLSVEEVRPSVWKPRMGVPGSDKEKSRRKALALFPKADVLRKKDHGRADALLLAEDLRRQREGGQHGKKD